MLRQRLFSGAALRAVMPAVFLFCIVFSLKAEDGRPVCYDALIEKISGEYELNPLFVRAVVWQESRFNAQAKGPVGEIGLMQVRMSTVKDWAKAHGKQVPTRTQVYQAELNLRIGVWRLDRALRNWEGFPDQTSLALYEYNAGRKSILRTLAHYDGEAPELLNSTRSSAIYARRITAKFEEYAREQETQYKLATLP